MQTEEIINLARAITFSTDSPENIALLEILNKSPERFQYGELTKHGEKDYRMQLTDIAAGREYSLRLPLSICDCKTVVLHVKNADKKYIPQNTASKKIGPVERAPEVSVLEKKARSFRKVWQTAGLATVATTAILSPYALLATGILLSNPNQGPDDYVSPLLPLGAMAGFFAPPLLLGLTIEAGSRARKNIQEIINGDYSYEPLSVKELLSESFSGGECCD